MMQEPDMREVMQALEQVFPGFAIALFVVPFSAVPGARVNYISNAMREDVRIMMKEVIARWEGRAHDAPGVQ